MENLPYDFSTIANTDAAVIEVLVPGFLLFFFFFNIMSVWDLIWTEIYPV